MLTLEEMADIILQMDEDQRDTAVDALSEADAKKMLKQVLSAMHRMHGPESAQ